MIFAAAVAGTAGAAGNLEKLGAFKTTGVTEFQVIDQTGPNADAIRETLKRINLPAGFKIDLYAVVPDAGHMAVGPQGIAVFVGTRKTDVWVVTDRNKDRVADEVKDFAPSLAKSIPNGPCFTPDGFLYIAERNRVLRYPAAEFFYESPDVVAEPLVAEGKLIPPDEESYNHTARVCDIGPDGKIYITLGQPFNVAPADKLDLYRETGIGGIIRMNTDGTGREVYAWGVRNSVGMDFNPANGELWFTRQPGRRHGRPDPTWRAQSRDRERPAVRPSVVRWRIGKNQRLRLRDASGGDRDARGRDGRPCG